jgi:ATP-dependent helicase/DNAse subunit B
MFILHNQRASGFEPLGDDRFALDAALEDIVHAAIAHDALDRLLILVPTARRARLVRRAVIRQAFAKSGQPVTDVPVFTLEQFVRVCAEGMFGGRMPRLISDGYVSALMEEAAQNAARAKTLKFFTASAKAISAARSVSPVVLERLKNIILGLKEDGITPASLREDLDSDNQEVVDKARLADICALYEEYERLLGTSADAAWLCDKPALLNSVNALLQTYPLPSMTPEDSAVAQFSLLQAATANDGNAQETTRSSSLSLADIWRELCPLTRLLVADGFTEFKQPEQQFLAALYYAPFHVRVTLEYSPVNGPLFGGLDRTLEKLQGLAKSGLPLPDDDPRQPHFRAYSTDTDANARFAQQRERHQPLVSYLRRWLFNTTDDIHHDGFNGSVNIIGFESRADEARSITKLIKHLAQNEAVPLSEIVVVMRQPEQYTGLFREFFALYNVPANITDRFPLEKSPVVTAVFAALDMVLLGFRREDVLRALQSPYLHFTRHEGRRSVRLDAANLFTAAERLRITGGNRFGGARRGKDQWKRRLASRLEFLRRRQVALAADANADNDEVRETSTMLEEIELAQLDFQALAAMFPEPEEQMNTAEFVHFVRTDILKALRVRESILAFHNHIKQELGKQQLGKQSISGQQVSGSRTYASAPQIASFLRLEEEVEQDARALTALEELLDEMVAVAGERNPTEQYDIADFAERLRTATRATRYQVREKLGYGVTVTSIEQIRSIPFRVTILCGAVDGEFPVKYVPESFLGKELADTEERFLQSERVQFFQALTNAPRAIERGQKQVFITYPTAQGDVELPRSSFVAALLRVTSLEQHGGVVLAQDVRNRLAYLTHNNSDSSNVHATEAAPRLALQLAPQHVQQTAWQQAIAIGIASDEELLREASVRYAALALQEERWENDVINNKGNNAENEMFERFVELAASSRARQEMERVRAFLHRAVQKRLAGDAPNDVRIEALRNVEPSAQTAFSISALEQYKKCPYQYFAERTLRLRETLTFDTSLSPIERGSLLHKILFRFYRTLQADSLAAGIQPIKPLKEGLPELVPVQFDGERVGAYQAALRNIAEEEIEALRFDHPFFDLDKEELVGSEEKKGKLPQWLDNELARVSKGWTHQPALFEFAFGERQRATVQRDARGGVQSAGEAKTGDAPAGDAPAGDAPDKAIRNEIATGTTDTSVTATAENALPPSIPPVQISEHLRLRGKIDRIEVNLAERTFVIADYKTGMSGVAANKDIEHGVSLQMPLYAEAARALLKELYGLDLAPEAMVYYLLSPKDAEEDKSQSFVLLPKDSPLMSVAGVSPRASKQLVTSTDEAQSLMQGAVEYAGAYAQSIAAGEFPVLPLNSPKPCGHCKYKSVCRVAEL